MAPPAAFVVAPVQDASPIAPEVGTDLDHHAASRRRPAWVQARELCEELARLVEALVHSGLTPAHPEAKALLADLRADAGELLVRITRLAIPVLTSGSAEDGVPAWAGGCAAAGAGDALSLERLLDLLVEELRAAALGDAGRPCDLAQERTGHQLTAIPVDGGVDLVLAVVPAAERRADRQSSPRGCPTPTPMGDL
jgi:hypothetical protein